MHITTFICPDCGTIVAENVLEEERIMKCPYYECEQILSFEDLEQKATSPIKSQGQSE